MATDTIYTAPGGSGHITHYWDHPHWNSDQGWDLVGQQLNSVHTCSSASTDLDEKLPSDAQSVTPEIVLDLRPQQAQPMGLQRNDVAVHLTECAAGTDCPNPAERTSLS